MQEEIATSWGSMSSSMLTFFLSVTGGVNWIMLFETATLLGKPYSFIIVFFIFFMVFSVLNIVTGVVVDGAIQRGNCDRSVRMELDTGMRMQFVQDMLVIL